MACCCDGKKGEREAVLYNEAVVGIFFEGIHVGIVYDEKETVRIQ